MFKKRKEYLVFGSPLIEEPEIQEVVDTLESAWLGTGPKVAKFEDIFTGCKGAIAFSVSSQKLRMEK
jgi:dTDP-4-amino-4,6-dideoxygalactose transaminase